MRKKLTVSLILIFLAFIGLPTVRSEEIVAIATEPSSDIALEIHLFESLSCSHCRREMNYLTELADEFPNVVFNAYEISENEQNLQLMVEVGRQLEVDVGSIPFLVIGEDYIVGFGGADTTGEEIKSKIALALENKPRDVVNDILTENPTIKAARVALNNTEKPEKAENEKKTVFEIKMPTLDLESLPLPVFTFVVALMDGFNPCAMWALLFLITLLIGMQDRKKMWILGGTFILTSGFVYFLFLAAWLNFFLIVGYTLIVRYIVGLFAIALGIYYLYDSHKNEGGCAVTGNEKRRNILERIKQVVLNKHLSVAIFGMILLAVAVNLIELLCSAGLPAVYTKVLSMSNLPVWQYYLYLVFYIIVFMLDDMIVFIGAMITMEAFGIKEKYAGYSHFIGGIIVLLIGLALIFKPELLSFN